MTTNIFGMTDTWNAAGTTFTAIQMNVTDTASASGSLLLDLQVGGASKFSVGKNGQVLIPSGGYGTTALNFGTLGNGIYVSGSTMAFATGGTVNNYVNLNGGFDTAAYYGLSIPGTSTPDVILARDAANTLALRNGTNAQTLNVYNTFTDASNYERGALYWNANVLTLAAQNAGTGAARNILISVAGGNNVQLNNGYIYAQLSGYNFQLGPSLTLKWASSTGISPPSDGNLTLTNNAGTSFGLLQLGGTTSSFPAIKRNGAAINFRLADDSADAAITVSTVKTVATTVATLPAAATAGAGARAFVTDSTVAASGNFGATVAGTGTNSVPVFSNGTNWLIG